jgi:hypothetical protein
MHRIVCFNFTLITIKMQISLQILLTELKGLLKIKFALTPIGYYINFGSTEFYQKISYYDRLLLLH